MVQLQVLSGGPRRAVYTVGEFPWRVGRGQTADLRLEEPGVWEEHLVLDFIPLEGYVITRQGEALAAVNGENFERRRLRNGDLIEMGAVKLRFWLAQTSQRGLRFRELAVWVLVALLVCFEVMVIETLTR